MIKVKLGGDRLNHGSLVARGQHDTREAGLTQVCQSMRRILAEPIRPNEKTGEMTVDHNCDDDWPGRSFPLHRVYEDNSNRIDAR